jgi:hypothetical protein
MVQDFKAEMVVQVRLACLRRLLLRSTRAAERHHVYTSVPTVTAAQCTVYLVQMACISYYTGR